MAIHPDNLAPEVVDRLFAALERLDHGRVSVTLIVRDGIPVRVVINREESLLTEPRKGVSEARV